MDKVTNESEFNEDGIFPSLGFVEDEANKNLKLLMYYATQKVMNNQEKTPTDGIITTVKSGDKSFKLRV